MNIFLSTLTLNSFNDPEILRVPRYKRIAHMQFGYSVTHAEGDEEPRLWDQYQAAELWSYLDQPGNVIVGFNVIDFDLPVIQGATGQPIELWQLTTLDLFALIKHHTGRWYKQHVLAVLNLGHGRGGDGVGDPTDWLRSGDPQQIQMAINYCKAGVILNRKLLNILQSGKPLLLPAQPEREIYDQQYFFLDPDPRFVLADPTQPAIY
jgi:hypothetical protein